MDLLHKVNNHDDLLRLNDDEKIELCSQIRSFLIESVSKTGGHLAGNLGIVELSVALETVYDTRSDRLVFDVGHQSYVHKILTGRAQAFSGLRQYEGISGFPKPSESDTDAFVAGHASSSVSIALGMARARTLLKQDYNVVAVIGDGAATGGMAYEGLNDAGASKEPMVIILNDNEMSIGKNVGGMSRHLSRIRSSKGYVNTKRWYRSTIQKIPGGKGLYHASSRLKNRVKRFLLPSTIFENMGLTYLGPVDGHDLPALTSILRTAKALHEPVLIHVVTKKGFGYPYAEADPAKFHGIGKFDPQTGKKLGGKVPTFSDSFGETIVELAKRNDRICAITAAMPGGTGLLPFMRQFPERLFDVGIAEEHAVSMAGGLAKQGMIPVVAIYSTFLQRAYDQIMQDICMLHLHVILCIDRAGLVGDDGPTHHGVFDVGFLRQMPGMLVLAPATLAEQRAMITWAVQCYDGPVAIRYPRGGEPAQLPSGWDNAGGSDFVCHRSGSDVVFVTYGTLVHQALLSAQKLETEGISAGVLRILNLSQLPIDELTEQLSACKLAVIVEEISSGSGIGSVLSSSLSQRVSNCQIILRDLGADFVPHGSQPQLYQFCGLDGHSLAEYVKGVLSNEK